MFVLFDLHWNMYYHRMWYKKNVENAGHGLWLYDIKGIYIFDASEASIAIYKGN